MHKSCIMKNGRYNTKENKVLGASEMGNRDDINGKTKNLQQEH